MLDLVRSALDQLGLSRPTDESADETTATESGRAETTPTNHPELRAAADRLRYSPDWSEADLETVGDALSDPDPVARAFAAEVIAAAPARARSRAVDFVPTLIDLLDDDVDRVRRQSARALGSIAESAPDAVADHVPELADTLSAHNVHVIDGVGKALVEVAPLAPDEVVEAVAGYADPTASHSTRTRAVSVLAAAARADPSAVEPVIPRVIDLLETRAPGSDRSAEVLSEVAGEYPGRVAPATQDLLSVLREDDTEARAATIETLSSILAGGEPVGAIEETVAPLTEHLGGEEPACADEAVDALAAAVDRSPGLGEKIAETLATMDGQDALRAARRLVESGDERLETAARDGLSDSSLGRILD